MDVTPSASPGRAQASGTGQSPEYVRLSSAAAMALGLKGGRFYRNARLHCLNLLLTYDEPCLGRCAYCGLSGARAVAEHDKSFIRVEWPTHSVEEVLARLRPDEQGIERVCISMVTLERAMRDVLTISERVRQAVDVPISILVAPTPMPGDRLHEEFERLRQAGCGWVGVAIDAATDELFDRHRGRGVRGPHAWDKYWQAVEAAVEVFGPRRAGVHLVVGLGETERQMVQAIERAHSLGAPTHLFSFYPESGCALVDAPRPEVGQYRRVQLARFLINEGFGDAGAFTYGPGDRISGFGVDARTLDECIESGLPFRTCGCPGGTVAELAGRKVEIGACNRPYANSPPGPEIRNYPFQPNADDIATIKSQIWG
jgi:biotin synthase-related radical SAM superfamily protein